MILPTGSATVAVVGRPLDRLISVLPHPYPVFIGPDPAGQLHLLAEGR